MWRSCFSYFFSPFFLRLHSQPLCSCVLLNSSKHSITQTYSSSLLVLTPTTMFFYLICNVTFFLPPLDLHASSRTGSLAVFSPGVTFDNAVNFTALILYKFISFRSSFHAANVLRRESYVFHAAKRS